MTYLHVQQLTLIRDEFNAARVSLAYIQDMWQRIRSEPNAPGVPLAGIENALRNLEMTYTLRAFIRFEALLKEHLEARGVPVPRGAEVLINSVARRQRPRIADDIRFQAHAVREYRNVIVHSSSTSVTTITFQSALSYLNQFLSRVEDIF